MIRLTDHATGAKVAVEGQSTVIGIDADSAHLAEARRAAVTADLIAATLSLGNHAVLPASADLPASIWVGQRPPLPGVLWVRPGPITGEYGGIDDPTWRLLCLQHHYATPCVVDGLARNQARTALLRLQRAHQTLLREAPGGQPAPQLSPPAERFGHQLRAALADDLATPEALAVLRQALDHDIPPADRLAILTDAARLLGVAL